MLFRLSVAEKDAYLKRFLEEEEDAGNNVDPSDSEDEDWFPSPRAARNAQIDEEASDAEDFTEEFAEDEQSVNNDGIQGGEEEEDEDDADREDDAEEGSDDDAAASPGMFSFVLYYSMH